MTLYGFLLWLQSHYVIPCTGCGHYVTTGDVRRDGETWLLACAYCQATVARATHLDPIPREARLDA